MEKKNFVLSYYKNADAGIHVQRIENSMEAQKPHSHDYFQIYYVSRGTLRHFTGEVSSGLARGDMFIIPPGKTHCIRDLEDVLFYTVSFDAEKLNLSGGANRLISGFLGNLEKEDTIRAKISVRDGTLLAVESILEQMYTEFSEKDIGYGDAVHAYVILLLTVFARNYFEHVKPGIAVTDNRTMVLHCIEYMNQNYSEKLSLAEMAKEAAMSKSSFSRQFVSLTGETFHSHLNRLRIQRAAKYIEDGYKITAIYGLCGYSDFSTFFRNFKRIMGCSPEKYRLKR